MQAPYEADAEGRLVPALPAQCPLGEDGSGCRVGVHHWRPRKTGPGFALAVARCHAHGCTFTVYPPGHVPYGRVPVVAVDAAGRAVRGAPEQRWQPTVFGAALDAAAGQRWPEHGGPWHRRTQGRWLERGATLLGLSAETTPKRAELIASALSVPLLALTEAARSYRHAGRSWVARAAAVADVLRRVAVSASGGVLVSGQIGGLWGRPSRWDPGGGVLRAVV